MSNIIKSFRVIEYSSPVEVKKDNKDNKDNELEHKINEEIIEKGRIEYEKLIQKAKVESKKIIEKAEAKEESLINNAYNKAKEILQESKEKGYKEGYEIGYEIGYENGHNEGFDKGYSEGKEESNKLIQDSLQLKSEYLAMRKNQLKELETDIIQLVISIYEKIIYKKNEEDKELIISLVLNGISNLDLTDKLTIIASKEDYNILEMNRDEILANASMISELEIKYDNNFKKGECILETTKGNIDVSLNNQLDEVRDLLTNILNNE